MQYLCVDLQEAGAKGGNWIHEGISKLLHSLCYWSAGLLIKSSLTVE
jgi:hypothetical protein